MLKKYKNYIKTYDLFTYYDIIYLDKNKRESTYGYT